MINKLQTILYLLVFGSFKLDKQNQSYERKKKLRLPYFNSKIRGASIAMTPPCIVYVHNIICTIIYERTVDMLLSINCNIN